jgi:aldose 1-epimerase
VLTYGGVIQALHVPDRDGRVADVTLGYDTLDAYRRDPRYFGALVGRYANRIAGGRFALDGQAYALATNDGPNHLHGGPGGFHTAVWEAAPFTHADAAGVRLTHRSPAGDEATRARWTWR